MIWQTQCFAPCNILQSFFLKLTTKACDPLALITISAKAKSNKFQRLTFYFHYSLVSPDAFHWVLIASGNKWWGLKRETRHFLWFVQRSNPQRKTQRMLVQKQCNRLCERACFCKCRACCPRGWKRFPGAEGRGTREEMLWALRRGVCNDKHSGMEGPYPSFLGKEWGAALCQSGNGYPSYQHKFARGNHTVCPCPLGWRQQTHPLCPGDVWISGDPRLAGGMRDDSSKDQTGMRSFSGMPARADDDSDLMGNLLATAPSLCLGII